MKHKEVLLAIAASICAAASPAPFSFQLWLVDRVSAAAKEGPPAQSSALEILERVAEGRMQDASPDLESRVGLEPGKLRGPEFKDESVRSHALRKIGQLDLPEALTYLQNLKRGDVGPDTSGQMWSSAQIALREAELIRIPDEPARVRFLEDTTGEKTAAASWAVEELCNRGSRQSLPSIRESILRRDPTSRGADEITFCEARMDIIARDPDRAKALGSFLSVSSGVTDHHLLGWTINQLRALGSPEAEAQVQRYADEIESLPDDSPLRRALWGERVGIRGMGPTERR